MKQNALQCELFLLFMEEYIKDLEEKIQGYEFVDMLKQVSDGYQKDVPHETPNMWNPHTCPKCGIQLDRVMGYCCPNIFCPTGMGPVTCQAT